MQPLIGPVSIRGFSFWLTSFSLVQIKNRRIQDGTTRALLPLVANLNAAVVSLPHQYTSGLA
jgi:hypothetical protein